MSEVSDRYSTIADGFTAHLVGVPPDRWSTPSPCTDWVAADVVAHVINTHRRVLSTLDGSEPASVASGDDLPGAWSAATADLLDALNDEVRASTVIGGMFGEQPFESLVSRLLCADTLVHTWDLARATGQDEHLDPAGVAKAMEFLGPLDGAIRRPGGFAPKIEPAAGADEQTRFLNFCGRAV
ncbi:MAG TPA: TIGR03086 family metal-binding protein [Acidimicrobiales bacterium]|nr:TIGR03086 family metal-binding protein [Acidimicrobiales bacterium]